MPTRKISALQANLVMVVKQISLTAKFIASLVGKIISTSLVIMTRALHSVLETPWLHGVIL